MYMYNGCTCTGTCSCNTHMYMYTDCTCTCILVVHVHVPSVSYSTGWKGDFYHIYSPTCTRTFPGRAYPLHIHVIQLYETLILHVHVPVYSVSVLSVLVGTGWE